MIGIFQDNFILQNVCYYTPDVFYAGKDFFLLGGGLNLNGPRLSPVAANLKFRKPAGQPVQLAGVEPINLEFEGKGYVKFVAKNATPLITGGSQGGKFQLNGIMTEPDKFNDINSQLIVIGPPDKSPDQRFKVEAENDFDLVLAANSFNLKLKSALSKKKFNYQPFNGMMVAGNDWDNLQFTGELIELPNTNTTLTYQGNKNVLTFTVYGDIQATSDNVQVSNIGPISGGTTLTYIKSEQRLVGNVTLVKQPVGPYAASGAMEFSIGKPGWYMVAAAQIAGIPVINDLSAGFLLGNYKNLPDNVIKTATQFSKTVPCKLSKSSSNFSGFFITGQKSMPLIPNVDIGFNAGIASFYLRATMPTLDVSMFASFNDFTVTMGLGIYAGVHAGMSSITCTNISGGADVIGRVSGTYDSGNKNVTVTGNVCGSVEVNITQGIPTVVSCEENTTIFHANEGVMINAFIDSQMNKSFGFSLNSGGCPDTCF
jgi:hypothetical protein